MKNWVYNSFEADAAFCAPGSPTVSVFREHPWPNNVIKIAGDGYAYLSYFTIENTSTDRKPSAQPFSPAAYEVHAQLIAHLAAGDGTAARANVDALWAAAGWTHDEWNYETLVAFWGNEGIVENLLTPVNTMFRHQCDVTGIETWQLHLLRVGSDGSSSDQIVKAWHDAFSTTYSVSTSFPYWHRTRFHTRELDIDFSEHIITNVDQGALYSWQAVEHCGAAHDDTSGDTTDIQIESCPDEPEDHLTTTRNGAVVSDVVWTPGASAGNAVEPILQLEDGSFAGTVSTETGGGVLVVFDSVGHGKWSIPGYEPLIATPSGGLTATASDGNYTFDNSGTAINSLGSLAIQSWQGHSYRSGSVQRIAAESIPIAVTFASQAGENPSRNRTAVLPRAMIQVRCRAVEGWAGFFGDHCYGLTWDPESGIHTIEGWEKDFHVTGTLVMRSVDGWPHGANKLTDQIYYRKPDAAVELVTCLKQVALAIEAVQAPYVASGPNSNSALATALQYCGLPTLLPVTAIGKDYYVAFSPF